MMTVDKAAKTNIVVFNIMYDQHSGEVAVGRVFSGIAKKGVELNISGKANPQKIQQVGRIHGPGEGHSRPDTRREHSRAHRAQGHIGWGHAQRGEDRAVRADNPLLKARRDKGGRGEGLEGHGKAHRGAQGAVEAGPDHKGRDKPGDWRAPHQRDGRAAPGDNRDEAEGRLRDQHHHERADSGLPGDDREGTGGADREQEPEQAHQVLDEGGAAQAVRAGGAGRRGDKGRRAEGSGRDRGDDKGRAGQADGEGGRLRIEQLHAR